MDAAVLVAGPPLGETGPSQIVLIDASVPDAGKVAAGVAPGVTAALLDPNGDEAGQIADYLTSRCIAGLAVIDIVSNDSDCTISPGSSVLDAGTIAANAKDLAAIGAALAPNVPFGCSAATWRRTRAMSRFLPDPHRREP
jgi:hypothetical protein